MNKCDVCGGEFPRMIKCPIFKWKETPTFVYLCYICAVWFGSLDTNPLFDSKILGAIASDLFIQEGISPASPVLTEAVLNIPKED